MKIDMLKKKPTVTFFWTTR